MRVTVQTPEGVSEYEAFNTYIEIQQAIDSGQIHIGDDIIYRGTIQCQLIGEVADADGAKWPELLVVTALQVMPPFNVWSEQWNSGG